MRKVCRRVWILSRLAAVILKAKLLKKRIPIFLGFYITNQCNLRCSYCCINVGGRFDDPNRPRFNTEEILRIIDEMYAMGTRWIFMLGGEPLLHPGIGAIVKHVVDKGILLHILTNGILIEQKIDEIDCADGVCVSIDGLEEATDKMRGKGTFCKALHGVEVALSRGMRVRIHALLNRHSLGDMEMLAEIAKKMNVTITIAPPNHLGTVDDSSLQLTKEEYRDFYRRYRRLKEEGYPIGNSLFSIDKALHWPVGYYEFISTGQHFSEYKPILCVIGHLHGCIDAEGTMFNCIQLGCMNGPNIKEVGIRQAWDGLANIRPKCVSCASVNTIETAAYLNLLPEVVIDGFKFFFGKVRR